MKAMVCEMCDSKDLIKQEGVYVCQNCGTKYSVEEAKKLMIEGTVDVSGSTVKIDNSSEIENLYELARRAKNSRDYQNGIRYYDQILIKDSSSWEAYLYSTCFAMFVCKEEEIKSSANKIIKAIPELLKLANNIEDVKERKKIISEICAQVKIAAKEAYSKMGIVSNVSSQERLAVAIYVTEIKPTLCKTLIDLYLNDNEIFPEICIPIIKDTIREERIEPLTINSWENAIKKYEPEYTATSQNNIGNYSSQTQKSGCYIATAVYGSYDCPQVWTLRRYRDYELAKTWYGRAFIRIYYAISPALVNWFGHTEWFKRMWRGKLDWMVKVIQEKGYESTPYEDRNW